MNLSIIRTLLASTALVGILAGPTAQASIMVSFQRVTNNNAENLSGQLGLTILDQAEASATYGLGIGMTDVLFTYTNNVGIASNISEVYIDDGTVVTLNTVVNSLGGFTNFAAAPPLSPGNLPGGNTLSPPFVATLGFSADTAPGGPANGVNDAADILGIVYSTTGGLTGIQNALDDGSLRVGLHVRSIGVAGGSDSYVNTPGQPVPEPGTLALISMALLGAGMSRRRQGFRQG